MEILFNDRNGVKSDIVKQLICHTLDILEYTGFVLSGLSIRTKEQVAMVCLALADIKSSFEEATSGKYLTSKEIIKYWNEYLGDTMSTGSYDSVRDNAVKKLLDFKIVLSRAEQESLTKNSSTAGYKLAESFIYLLKAYDTEEKESALTLFIEDKEAIVEQNNEENTSSDSKNIGVPHQQIFYGAPGTGKSHGINEQTKGQSVIRTTFHPDSDYSTFVGAYKPTTLDIPVTTIIGTKAAVVEDVDGKPMMESKIVYEFVEQAFLKAYIKAWKNFIFYNEQPQYLIIEEINRGNCAQIFGDLFQLLDRNSSGFSVYPIHTDSDMRKQLRKAFARTDEPEKQIFMQDSDKQRINQFYDGKDIISEVLSGEVLLLPNNLYIWATMNTSDQSLFPIDSAFKRRWEWKYVPIKYDNKDWKVELEDGSWCKWTDLQHRLNDLIYEATESEDKMLGDWFVKADKDIISEEQLVGKIIFYLWNDVAKIDSGNLFDIEVEKGERKRKVIFSDFYDIDGSVRTDIVKSWLNKIGIELMEKNSDTEDGTDPTNTDDTSRNRYKLNNGALESLKDIANHVVRDFVINNPTMNAQQIRDLFVEAYKGCGIAHIVETDEEYKLREGQASWERSASTVTLPNGEKVHVCTQFRAKNEGDNFFNFIKVTKEKGWGEITE